MNQNEQKRAAELEFKTKQQLIDLVINLERKIKDRKALEMNKSAYCKRTALIRCRNKLSKVGR